LLKPSEQVDEDDPGGMFNTSSPEFSIEIKNKYGIMSLKNTHT